MLAWHCLWLSCCTDRALGLAALRAPVDGAAGGRQWTVSSQRYGSRSGHRWHFRHEQHHGATAAARVERESMRGCKVQCSAAQRSTEGWRNPPTRVKKSPSSALFPMLQWHGTVHPSSRTRNHAAIRPLRAWLCRCAIAARVTQTHLASDSTVCEWRCVCVWRWTKKCPGS